MNTTPLYIFDLDGTLADLKHRRHHVERPANCKCDNAAKYTCLDCGSTRGTGRWKPNWDAFHAACVDDTPIKPVIAACFALAMSDPPDTPDIWVWSGRSATVEVQTRAWLSAWCPWYLKLKMRPAGDFAPDDTLKETWLKAMSPEDRARLVMTFDDRDRVVAMWRRNGIVCAQVAPGDF